MKNRKQRTLTALNENLSFEPLWFETTRVDQGFKDRIEERASSYLQGRPLVIHSASLLGPFSNVQSTAWSGSDQCSRWRRPWSAHNGAFARRITSMLTESTDRGNRSSKRQSPVVRQEGDANPAKKQRHNSPGRPALGASSRNPIHLDSLDDHDDVAPGKGRQSEDGPWLVLTRVAVDSALEKQRLNQTAPLYVPPALRKRSEAWKAPSTQPSKSDNLFQAPQPVTAVVFNTPPAEQHQTEIPLRSPRQWNVRFREEPVNSEDNTNLASLLVQSLTEMTEKAVELIIAQRAATDPYVKNLVTKCIGRFAPDHAFIELIKYMNRVVGEELSSPPAGEDLNNGSLALPDVESEHPSRNKKTLCDTSVASTLSPKSRGGKSSKIEVSYDFGPQMLTISPTAGLTRHYRETEAQYQSYQQAAGWTTSETTRAHQKSKDQFQNCDTSESGDWTNNADRRKSFDRECGTKLTNAQEKAKESTTVRRIKKTPFSIWNMVFPHGIAADIKSLGGGQLFELCGGTAPHHWPQHLKDTVKSAGLEADSTMADEDDGRPHTTFTGADFVTSESRQISNPGRRGRARPTYGQLRSLKSKRKQISSQSAQLAGSRSRNIYSISPEASPRPTLAVSKGAKKLAVAMSPSSLPERARHSKARSSEGLAALIRADPSSGSSVEDVSKTRHSYDVKSSMPMLTHKSSLVTERGQSSTRQQALMTDTPFSLGNGPESEIDLEGLVEMASEYLGAWSLEAELRKRPIVI